MCKLIILPTDTPRVRDFLDNLNVLPHELDHIRFPGWSHERLQNYGRGWAKFFKTDIVMLEEDDV